MRYTSVYFIVECKSRRVYIEKQGKMRPQVIGDSCVYRHEFEMCLISRFFPYSCLGRPLASRPTQAVLQEKFWNEKQQQILPTTYKCPLSDVAKMHIHHNSQKDFYCNIDSSNGITSYSWILEVIWLTSDDQRIRLNQCISIVQYPHFRQVYSYKGPSFSSLLQAEKDFL